MPKHPNLTRAAINEMNSDFIRCRSLRHAWDPIGGGERRPLFGDLVTLRCIFCGTLRYDKFSRITGARLAKPQYDYPPGYRDAESHNADWWRAAWAETITDKLVGADHNVTPIKRRKNAS